jgi:hypothetical protein
MVAHVAKTKHAHSWYELDACLRGPGLAHERDQLARLLASTTLIRTAA